MPWRAVWSEVCCPRTLSLAECRRSSIVFLILWSVGASFTSCATAALTCPYLIIHHVPVRCIPIWFRQYASTSLPFPSLEIGGVGKGPPTLPCVTSQWHRGGLEVSNEMKRTQSELTYYADDWMRWSACIIHVTIWPSCVCIWMCVPCLLANTTRIISVRESRGACAAVVKNELSR